MQGLGPKKLILFVGKPFSGKDLQKRLLRESLLGKGIVSVSASEALVRYAERNGPLSGEIRRLMASGKIVGGQPRLDRLTKRLFFETLDNHWSEAEGKILNVIGFPRSQDQSHWLKVYLEGKGYRRRDCQELVTLVEFGISHAESRRRLSLGPNPEDRGQDRRDDKPEILEERLRQFDEHTITGIAYLKQVSLCTPFYINGERSVDDVHQELLDCLGIKNRKVLTAEAISA